VRPGQPHHAMHCYRCTLEVKADVKACPQCKCVAFYWEPYPVRSLLAIQSAERDRAERAAARVGFGCLVQASDGAVLYHAGKVYRAAR
jgi:hypothetical protein